jgi:hypothetical protein
LVKARLMKTVWHVLSHMWNLRVKGHESKRGTIMDVEGKKGREENIV